MKVFITGLFGFSLLAIVAGSIALLVIDPKPTVKTVEAPVSNDRFTR